jgi:hypothetical protein
VPRHCSRVHRQSSKFHFSKTLTLAFTVRHCESALPTTCSSAITPTFFGRMNNNDEKELPRNNTLRPFLQQFESITGLQKLRETLRAGGGEEFDQTRKAINSIDKQPSSKDVDGYCKAGQKRKQEIREMFWRSKRARELGCRAPAPAPNPPSSASSSPVAIPPVVATPPSSGGSEEIVLPEARDFVEEWGMDPQQLVSFSAQWSRNALAAEPATLINARSAIRLPRLVKLIDPDQGDATTAVAILWSIDCGLYPYVPHIEPRRFRWYHTGTDEETKAGELVLLPRRVCFFFTVLDVHPRHSLHHALIGQMFSSFQFLNQFFGIPDDVDALTRWCLYGSSTLLPLRSVLATREKLDSHVIQAPELVGDLECPDFPTTVGRLSMRDMLASMCRWECDEYRCSARLTVEGLCSHGYQLNYATADEARELLSTGPPSTPREVPSKAQKQNRYKARPYGDHNRRAVILIEQRLSGMWSNRITFTDATNFDVAMRLEQGHFFVPLLELMKKLYLREAQGSIAFPFQFRGHQHNAAVVQSLNDVKEWAKNWAPARQPVIGLSKYLANDGSQCALTRWTVRQSDPPSPYLPYCGSAHVPIPLNVLDHTLHRLVVKTASQRLGEHATQRSEALRCLAEEGGEEAPMAVLWKLTLGYADDALFNGANSALQHLHDREKMLAWENPTRE